MRLPVVVSDLPWVHELIEPERDALVVPIAAAAVAEAVLRVLSDRLLAARLSRHGRRLAAEHRNREAEMDRLADHYRTLAA